MANKKKTTEVETPTTENQVPVTNEQRMAALEEQKKQLEASFQKVIGAMELLQAIMAEENKDG